MFGITTIDLQRITVSGLGALLLTAASIGGVSAPARAATPSVGAVDAWRQDVAAQLDRGLLHNSAARIATNHEGSVVVSLAADGTMIDARIGRSTGVAMLDAEALAAAHRIRFPAVPGGKPATVALNVMFGPSADAVAAPLRSANRAAAQVNKRFAARIDGDTQLALAR